MFSENCIVRGLQTYNEIGDECYWMKKANLTEFQVEIK